MKPYGPDQGSTMKPYEASRSPMKPYGAIWSLIKPHEAFWSFMKPYEALWSLRKVSESLRIPVKPYEASWSPMKLYEAPRSPMKPCEALWSLMKPWEDSWSLWSPTKPYGVQWSLVGPHAALWSPGGITVWPWWGCMCLLSGRAFNRKFGCSIEAIKRICSQLCLRVFLDVPFPCAMEFATQALEFKVLNYLLARLPNSYRQVSRFFARPNF